MLTIYTLLHVYFPGTDDDKYDTIFDLQHFEKRDVSVGYVLDVTEIGIPC